MISNERFDSPLWLSSASSLLLWAALPPLNWWPLAWIAPVCWLRLITQDPLRGRRPYVAIWFSSVLFWMAVMQGIRLAHWANYLGLLALGSYLGIYVPLFIAVARHAVHRWHVPLPMAAPIAWTGVELLRGYGPLGFSMATLAHTQVGQLRIIQVADLFGAYTISFVVMSVAAGVLAAWPDTQRRWRAWPVLYALLLVVLVVGYGQYRLGQRTTSRGDRAEVRVALIQGSIDTIFEDNPDRFGQILEQYSELTRDACARYGPLDLIVWPESMFPLNDVLVEPGVELELDPTMDRAAMEDNIVLFNRLVRNGIRRANERDQEETDTHSTSWMLGTATWQFGDYPPRRYNAALMVNPQAEITARYFKMHPVIFGEYVPLGDIFPALYDLFPLPNGLTAGTEPVAVSVGGLNFSPSICFENTMPHLIRWQVAELSRRGMSPDVLVNLTNDGWFWGSSILDMQLDCAVLRAVELRRPFLVAANTGFSAWINGHGQILAQGPRRATGTLLAEVSADGRWSGYERWGDAPVSLCTLFCMAAVLSGSVSFWRERRKSRSRTTI
jgi:apolipoprotein N-acyltransferase